MVVEGLIIRLPLGVPWHTALHLAARYGHAEVAAALAARGAALDAADSHGFAPLHYAAAHGHLKVIPTPASFLLVRHNLE